MHTPKLTGPVDYILVAHSGLEVQEYNRTIPCILLILIGEYVQNTTIVAEGFKLLLCLNKASSRRQVYNGIGIQTKLTYMDVQRLNLNYFVQAFKGFNLIDIQWDIEYSQLFIRQVVTQIIGFIQFLQVCHWVPNSLWVQLLNTLPSLTLEGSHVPQLHFIPKHSVLLRNLGVQLSSSIVLGVGLVPPQ